MNIRIKSALSGMMVAVLMLGLLIGIQVSSAPEAAAAGTCTVQRYKTLLGARTVYRVKCPSRYIAYRAAVECEFFGVVRRHGAWHWNNVYSTISCNWPYAYKRGWTQWDL